jgi:hypothetical protein
MTLENPIWATLEGGYKIPYDASIPLLQLRVAHDEAATNLIFNELWDNLHHQGDVGLASYYAIPHLVDSCISTNSFDWNYVGLCLVIEHCRLSNNNPNLPDNLQEDYFNALNRLKTYLLAHFENINDGETLKLTLSLFATLKGYRELGKAIEFLDADVIQELLDQYS